MTGCLFCRIAGGEIPSTVVQQDDRFYAFRDIDPKAPVHVLAIPREHIASLNDVRGVDQVGGLLLFARDVARSLGLSERGYRVVLNTNADGGQTVFHLHVHVLGGRAMQWPPG
ncbi:MAG: histidine triad nucleotide-binding protein [Gemmatimonadetes bacterium]|nr:histidine triad nucleotide-binding protein [Gemmatimonadota bacterium]